MTVSSEFDQQLDTYISFFVTPFNNATEGVNFIYKLNDIIFLKKTQTLAKLM